jgi:CHASE2 domain-containing sensor protein
MTTPRRDPNGITVAALIITIFGALAAWTFVLGGWWIAAAVPCTLIAAFGILGLVESLQVRLRDDRGIQHRG